MNIVWLDSNYNEIISSLIYVWVIIYMYVSGLLFINSIIAMQRYHIIIFVGLDGLCLGKTIRAYETDRANRR